MLRNKLIKDNILNYLNPYDYFGFTSNAVIYGTTLVMGAGNAKAYRDRFHGLDQAMGEEITKHIKGYYYYFVSLQYQGYNIFAFQTKTHHQNHSNLELLTHSVKHLSFFAMQYKDVQFHLPLPGVGLGNLPTSEVFTILNKYLSQNIILYEYQSLASR